MTDARSILDKLAAPFAPDSISWRVGSTTADKSKGMALAYIDARDVQRRLDDVMGADWQCEYVPMANGTCCCRIGLKIDGEWRWRFDGWIDVEAIDRAEYDAHWAERAVAEYIQGKRREEQRRILNEWLRPYGFYCVSYRNWRDK